jgi:hypothetical protein
MTSSSPLAQAIPLEIVAVVVVTVQMAAVVAAQMAAVINVL